ncbi:MAG: DUF4358 domain-containing protein [Halanaerobiales bacterium]|nr:DUF4358 domain-containing protein [Halanaerobiales bacterium]
MKKVLFVAIAVLMVFVVVGCSGQTSNVPVKDILENIKEEVQIPMSGEIDLKTDENAAEMYNINLEDIEEGMVYRAMINIRADEIIILKAKDKSKVAGLEEALKEVYNARHNLWKTYLPQEFEKVENHILKTQGKYLILIISEDSEKVEEVFDNTIK